MAKSGVWKWSALRFPIIYILLGREGSAETDETIHVNEVCPEILFGGIDQVGEYSQLGRHRNSFRCSPTLGCPRPASRQRRYQRIRFSNIAFSIGQWPPLHDRQ